MKLCLLSALLFLLALPVVSLAAPDTLKSEQKRQFFDLGLTLSRGAFAYAPLAKEATAVGKTPSKIEQVRQLGRLDPLAGKSRAEARTRMDRTVLLMRRLHAPETAVAPVAAAAAQLAGPLPLNSDAQTLAFWSRPAARTVASLSEFQILASLPEDPAVARWLHAPGLPLSAPLWYSAGTLAGRSEIAAAHEMPDLLPPPAQVFTDLRGLRDALAWPLVSPDTIALRNALDKFLKDAPVGPGVGPRTLSLAQLQALAGISRRLQAQLGTEAAGPETTER